MVQGKLSKQQVKSNYEAQFNKFYLYFYRILLYTWVHYLDSVGMYFIAVIVYCGD